MQYVCASPYPYEELLDFLLFTKARATKIEKSKFSHIFASCIASIRLSIMNAKGDKENELFSPKCFDNGISFHIHLFPGIFSFFHKT